MKNRRYSDNDKHFWPFTFSIGTEHWRPKGIELDSGDADDYPGCTLRLYLGKYTLLMEMPPVLLPFRTWVTSTAGAPYGYWDYNRRKLGFTLSDGFLQIFLGRSTHDSSTNKQWCCHLPWTQWRFHRISYYDLEGGLHNWLFEESLPKGFARFEEQRQIEEEVPKKAFQIRDHDGELVDVTTYIVEREWKKGTGWFKWLSHFTKPQVVKCLDITFASEVGTDKGSWKGGMCGTQIEMLPGELHESAMRRFCKKEHRGKNGRYKLDFVE